MTRGRAALGNDGTQGFVGAVGESDTQTAASPSRDLSHPSNRIGGPMKRSTRTLLAIATAVTATLALTTSAVADPTPAPISAPSLSALQSIMNTECAGTTFEGLPWSTCGIRSDTDQLVVTFANAADVNTALTKAVAANPALGVAHSLVTAQLPMASFVARYGNTAPFTQGDAITTTEGYCSDSFRVHGLDPNSTPYIVTAGHCFPLVQPSSGYTVDAEASGGGNGAEIGTQEFQGLYDTAYCASNTCTDDSLVAGPGEVDGVDAWSNIWNGPFNTTVQTYVSGAANESAGTAVVVGGAVTGNVSATVLNTYGTDICVNVTGSDPGITGSVRICHIWEAASAPGTTIVQPGDSGGPVFTAAAGGDVTAVGSISAEVGGTTNGVWYTSIPSILAEWGVAIS